MLWLLWDRGRQKSVCPKQRASLWHDLAGEPPIWCGCLFGCFWSFGWTGLGQGHWNQHDSLFFFFSPFTRFFFANRRHTKSLNSGGNSISDKCCGILWKTRRYISNFVLRSFVQSFLQFSSNNLNIESTLLDTHLQSSCVSFYTS